ncbi:hypothetical protein AYI68_g7601 [Smittium mucronatum]|uniref:Uncharacterized protein n=1 Tax=Smittium mucronatum TaxID=133383 RepID=A0A1R0GN91_9FUNG|nr:hypothetical protein AYI68_g7601 [Smittium mucronatum]
MSTSSLLSNFSFDQSIVSPMTTNEHQSGSIEKTEFVENIKEYRSFSFSQLPAHLNVPIRHDSFGKRDFSNKDFLIPFNSNTNIDLIPKIQMNSPNFFINSPETISPAHDPFADIEPISHDNRDELSPHALSVFNPSESEISKWKNDSIEYDFFSKNWLP